MGGSQSRMSSRQLAGPASRVLRGKHRGNVGLLFGVDGWCGIEVLGAAHSTIFLVEMQIRTTVQYAHTQYVHIRDSTQVRDTRTAGAICSNFPVPKLSCHPGNEWTFVAMPSLTGDEHDHTTQLLISQHGGLGSDKSCQQTLLRQSSEGGLHAADTPRDKHLDY